MRAEWKRRITRRNSRLKGEERNRWRKWYRGQRKEETGGEGRDEVGKLEERDARAKGDAGRGGREECDQNWIG